MLTDYSENSNTINVITLSAVRYDFSYINKTNMKHIIFVSNRKNSQKKVLTSFESISSSSKSETDLSSTETTSLMNMIIETIQIIHQFSKYQHEVLKKVHSSILQMLQKDHKKMISMSSLND